MNRNAWIALLLMGWNLVPVAQADLRDSLEDWREIQSALKNLNAPQTCAPEIDKEVFCSDPYKALCSENPFSLNKNQSIADLHISDMTKYAETFRQGKAALQKNGDYLVALKEKFLRLPTVASQPESDKISIGLRIKSLGFDMPLSEAELPPQFQAAFLEACGPFGTEVTAFYTNDRMILCPGWVISAYRDANPAENLIASLPLVMGHEIGHSIQDLYVNFHPDFWKCVVENYQTEAPARWLDSKRSPLNTVGNLAVEIVADKWGVDFLVEEIANSKETKSREVLRKMRRAAGNLCGRIEDNHPSDKWRIQHMMGSHPQLREWMGCQKKLVNCS